MREINNRARVRTKIQNISKKFLKVEEWTICERTTKRTRYESCTYAALYRYCVRYTNTVYRKRAGRRRRPRPDYVTRTRSEYRLRNRKLVGCQDFAHFCWIPRWWPAWYDEMNVCALFLAMSDTSRRKISTINRIYLREDRTRAERFGQFLM